MGEHIKEELRKATWDAITALHYGRYQDAQAILYGILDALNEPEEIRVEPGRFQALMMVVG